MLEFECLVYEYMGRLACNCTWLGAVVRWAMILYPQTLTLFEFSWDALCYLSPLPVDLSVHPYVLTEVVSMGGKRLKINVFFQLRAPFSCKHSSGRFELNNDRTRSHLVTELGIRSRMRCDIAFSGARARSVALFKAFPLNRQMPMYHPYNPAALLCPIVSACPCKQEKYIIQRWPELFGVSITLAVQIDSVGFRIAIDGKYCATFEHKRLVHLSPVLAVAVPCTHHLELRARLINMQLLPFHIKHCGATSCHVPPTKPRHLTVDISVTQGFTYERRASHAASDDCR